MIIFKLSIIVKISKYFFFRNPEPGVLRNEPNGTNVYEGVPIDYTGEVSTICVCLQLIVDSKISNLNTIL